MKRRYASYADSRTSSSPEYKICFNGSYARQVIADPSNLAFDSPNGTSCVTNEPGADVVAIVGFTDTIWLLLVVVAPKDGCRTGTATGSASSVIATKLTKEQTQSTFICGSTFQIDSCPDAVAITANEMCEVY